ncbi:hypothetical protein NC652_029911 [Populus alba x Populus x berolinensis]|nr:hypothetical protein NC652_029911 [Populus alba x Populus x berolinensis]
MLSLTDNDLSVTLMWLENDRRNHILWYSFGLAKLVNQIGRPDLYIGVTKQRKCFVGSEKSRVMTFLVFHGVMGGDQEYLFADGVASELVTISNFTIQIQLLHYLHVMKSLRISEN